MNREWIGDTSRLIRQPWGRMPAGIVRSTMRADQVAPTMADGGETSAIVLDWADISAAS
jgi:hypothetical protein